MMPFYKKNTRGFTIMEILVVLVLSTFVTIGMFTVFDAQNQAAIRTEDYADINSVQNTSFNILVKHTRMAGYRTPMQSAINPINNFNISGGFNPATAFEGTVLKPALTADIKPGSDAMLLVYADNDCRDGTFVDASLPVHNVAGPTATRVCEPSCFTNGTGTYGVGDVMLVSSQKGDVFVKVTAVQLNQVSAGVCSGGPHSVITYVGIDELNLASRYNCASGDPCIAQVMTRLETAFVYYVNNSKQLMRMPMDNAVNPQLVSDGVEDLQLRYDQVVGCTASLCGGPCNDCDAPAVQPSPLTPFEEIRAVRLGMVLITLREDKTNFLNLGLPVNLFDRVYTSPPADSYRRRTVTHLIRVKNLEIQDL